ncbi:MAG: hypothetical protein IT285_14260 [Bdellovibrionales bacterium]|nr:hypothetical protein [Bdellovibrionales bacterium]
MHGESFRAGIRELVAIRRELMREANPALHGETLSDLAERQWEITRSWSPRIAEEIEGIAQGSGASIEDLVVLNNYTDFRDIHVPQSGGRGEEKGCSTLFVNTGLESVGGQTWDMHGTAKLYVAVLEVPSHDEAPEMLLFSLVGCVGLMGYTADGRMLGVNNLNTRDARPGLLWPALVREALARPDRGSMERLLKEAPVTSGHNYLVADATGGTHWEISPSVREAAGKAGSEPGFAFHTNHCLTEPGRAAETPTSLNSTTHVRYRLLEQKLNAGLGYEDVYRLLTDHEGYPKSICSHFQSSAKDPSFTCGGAIAELRTGQFRFWRGCPAADDSYVEREFRIEDGKFVKSGEILGRRPNRAVELP